LKAVVGISVLVLLSLWADLTFGRFLGSDIYPTEDELYEAYLIGQIDYQTYLNLREIINAGIDSIDLYLIEEIPNIDFFGGPDSGKYSDLEKEQAEPFISTRAGITGKRQTASMVWKRYQKLDEIGRDQNRFYIKSRLSPNWSFRINVVDEYIGHQEFSFRSLNYKNARGTIRKLAIGNFTARFGLGLTVGYRGRLFGKDYLSTEETLLYPDYGGFNGLYAEGGPRKNRVKWLFHYDKNDTLRVRTTALSVVKRYGFYRAEGTLLGSVIDNRLTGNEFRQYQLGLLLGYSGDNIEAAIEAALPENNLDKSSKNNQAAVAEITYRGIDFGLSFSAWHYGRNFFNLFGGGRSGDFYRTVALDNIDLNYRDRRNNQRGFLIRTLTSLSDQTDATMSLSIYGSSRYEKFVEIQASWGKIISETSRWRIYYELFGKEKFGEITNNNGLKLAYNYKLARLSLKSFLGYSYDNDKKKNLSLLFRARLKNKIFKEIEFWVNFSRINIETGNIDYFYGYIKEMVDIVKKVSLAVKYRYRYNRLFTEPEESTIYLEMSVVW